MAGAMVAADTNDANPSSSPSTTLPLGSAAAQRASAQAPLERPHHARSGELPTDYLSTQLADAELLLSYAAEAGLDVEGSVEEAVIAARVGSGAPMTPEIAVSLLAALTKLAVLVRPVTVASLMTCANDGKARRVITEYAAMTLLLILFIVPFSLITFLSAPLSERISSEIQTGNDLALKLSSELLTPPPAATNGTAAPTAAPPPAPSTSASAAAAPGTPALASSPPKPVPAVSPAIALADLQQFTSVIRTLDQCATRLNFFAFFSVGDPFAQIRNTKVGTDHVRTAIDDEFELPVPPTDLVAIATEKIVVYQHVRYYAQKVQSTVTAWFAAVTSCILPALYAMLGACAYLLRSLEEQLKRRTFIADRHFARFLIAAIGGLVVGLFADFNLVGNAKLPSLAVAFLLGYAVDVFFSFLETLLRTFGGTPAAAAPAAAPGKP